MAIAEASVDADLLLAPGTRLLHIGPAKTGTTSVQGAFHANRAVLAANGVRYAGSVEHSMYAVRLGTGRPWHLRRAFLPSRNPWDLLVRDVRDAGDDRVVISSEAFADTPVDRIPGVVEDLGGERVHVVVTLRPLAKIAPSMWQQYVRAGIVTSWEDWLRAQLTDPETPITPSFRYLHRHDDLVRRWTAVVGPGRVTVVAVDDGDHGMLLRTFERLTGLPEGALVAPPDRINRSFSLPEIEVIRAFNADYKPEIGGEIYHRTIRQGAMRAVAMREPAPSEARIQLPAWAVEPIEQRSREIVEAITASGVRVIGDIERLAAVPPARPDPIPEDRNPTPELTATFMAGIIRGAGILPDAERGPEDWAIPSSRLMRALWRRVGKRLTRVSRVAADRVTGRNEAPAARR